MKPEIHDPAPRLHKIGDALSQLLNVSTARPHTGTTSDESVSGRAYRLGLRREKYIDWWFSVRRGEQDHCRKAYERDVQRAEMLRAYDKARRVALEN